jgi:hypothetical protein
MFKFWCSVCIDDKDLYASTLDPYFAYATCPDCETILKEGYSRQANITDEDMTTESYKALHELDNNTP